MYESYVCTNTSRLSYHDKKERINEEIGGGPYVESESFVTQPVSSHTKKYSCLDTPSMYLTPQFTSCKYRVQFTYVCNLRLASIVCNLHTCAVYTAFQDTNENVYAVYMRPD